MTSPLPLSWMQTAFLGYTTALEACVAPEKVQRAPGEGLVAAIARDVLSKVYNDAWEILLVSCIVWAPTNALNFIFVPPRYRVLPSIATSLVYTCFLSTVSHRPVRPIAAPQPPLPSL